MELRIRLVVELKSFLNRPSLSPGTAQRQTVRKVRGDVKNSRTFCIDISANAFKTAVF